MNLDEMIKIWIEYKNFKCNKMFILHTTFRIIDGNLLNKVQYRSDTLVDYIIYNKMINKNDMSWIPFSPNIREKINYVYNQKIFDMDEFYNLVSELSEC